MTNKFKLYIHECFVKITSKNTTHSLFPLTIFSDACTMHMYNIATESGIFYTVNVQ